MEAAAMPLPSEETTPPVTKMNLAIGDLVVHRGITHADQLADPLQIRRSIHAERFIVRLDYADLKTVLERSQLFQTFPLLQRPNRQIGILQQKISAVHIEADMFVVRALHWNWRPRKV